MRCLIITSFFLVASCVAQSGGRVTPITSLPLNSRQVAVYRAALSELRAYGPYDLIDLTGVLRPDEGDYATCMKGFTAAAPAQSLHHLSSQFAKANHMHLISPETAAEHPFSSGYGSMGVHSMTESSVGVPPPDETACRVILSEIIFDSSGQRAALNVTTSCTVAAIPKHTFISSSAEGGCTQRIVDREYRDSLKTEF
jgi:hypothetical protein